MSAITHAMILAAGRGERMRPITDRVPKPLVRVRGSALIDSTLDRLQAAGVEHVVVNLHHLGHLIESHLASRARPVVRFSPEADLLDTGGGVANALELLGSNPFYVVNGDSLWYDDGESALRRLAHAWDPAKMDALLLLYPADAAMGYDGPGDYDCADTGALTSRTGSRATYAFMGVQILSPRLFDGVAVRPFSLKRLYDRAEENGRLFGTVHRGRWYHVGTPDALAAVEAALADES